MEILDQVETKICGPEEGQDFSRFFWESNLAGDAEARKGVHRGGSKKKKMKTLITRHYTGLEWTGLARRFLHAASGLPS